MNHKSIYGPSPLLAALKEIKAAELREKYWKQNMENDARYWETKKNYKENGIYEDNETSSNDLQ